MRRLFGVGLILVATAIGGAGANDAMRPRVGSSGVTVVLASGWHAWVPPAGVTPTVTDPLTRVVAVSAPFQFAANGCQVAAYAFRRDAVAVVVVEWVGATPGVRWPPRPRHFTRATLPLHPAPAIECFDGPGGSVEFADHGRRFGAYLMLGRRAPARLADRARAVLDTLRVRPR